LIWFNARFFTMPLAKDLYSRGGRNCSIEESLAENHRTPASRKISL